MHVLAAALLLLGAATPAATQPTRPIPSAAAGDSTPPRPRRPPRRQPVTPELERSAFADAEARSLLTRARAARLAQDSALRAYDARTYQRLSIGVGVRRTGPERLLYRHEQAARVRWARGTGIWIEPTGQRTAFPMGQVSADLSATTPVPYFPGRESLWLPSDGRLAQAEVDENELLHPLAAGAEAYYRYAAGDSMRIRLPDGGAVSLRELRVSARRADWRAFVGSFWIDVDRGSLVRAAYRLAADVDVWRSAIEDNRRQIEEWAERARTDTGAAAVHARQEAERLRISGGDALKLRIARGVLTPVRASLSAVTVEYGLFDGRFWLPRRNVAEGEGIAGFVRVPVRFEESFQYAAVNGADPLPPLPTPGVAGLAADDTAWVGGGAISVGLPLPGMDAGASRRVVADTSPAARAAGLARYRARIDSFVVSRTRDADSLRSAADRARAKGDTALASRLAGQASRATAIARRNARWLAECAHDSTYFAGFVTRYEGALRMAVRLPCSGSHVASTTGLPAASSDEAGPDGAERDALLRALGFGLQAAWSPQRPVLHTGVDLLRYDRIEGLSLGASATSALGAGYTARALARIGTGDWVPNGELLLARSNGRAELRLGAFHRLGVANDDWGTPLSFGASVANLINARDEGFYYRTWGAELAGARETPGPLGATLLWRTFVERQRSAGSAPNTQASLANLFGDRRFGPNIEAPTLTAVGVGGEVARSLGSGLSGVRLDTRLRVEAALTDRSDSVGRSGYGRLFVEGTLSRGVGPAVLSLTGAGGASAGDLPPQRAFYLGGLQTVRGQLARPDGAGRVGDAFWMARSELGLGRFVAVRPTVFYDVGWAGPRADVGHPGRPLSGAGAGLSFLEGLFRVDVARGIAPERRWRTDFSLGARF